jgi:hypothetical protein
MHTPGQGYLSRMASLLPLIQDILPMILPASVSVTKATEILPPDTQPSEGQDVRVISRNAVVDKTDRMCTSGEPYRSLDLLFPSIHIHFTVLIIKPESSSSIRHHGEQGAFHRPFRRSRGRTNSASSPSMAKPTKKPSSTQSPAKAYSSHNQRATTRSRSATSWDRGTLPLSRRGQSTKPSTSPTPTSTWWSSGAGAALSRSI